MTFWQFLNDNLKTLAFLVVLGFVLGTGAYHVGDLIKVAEKIALNLSRCGK